MTRFTNSVKTEVPKYVPNEYNPENLPIFAQIFYASDLPDEDKRDFWVNFLHTYLLNREFRRNHQGMFIFIIDGRFFGIFPHEKKHDLSHEIVPRTIEITDNPMDLYMMVYQEIVSAGKVSSFKLGKVDLKIYLGNYPRTENRLIDTGASKSTIPFLEYWDHKKLKYKIENLDSKGRKYKFELEYLNSNIDEKKDCTVKTGSGIDIQCMICWKEPLIVSIKNLPPLKITKMLAPTNPDSSVLVIGADILYYHSIHITNIDGDLKFIIQPSSMFGDVDEKEFDGIDFPQDIDELNKCKISVINEHMSISDHIAKAFGYSYSGEKIDDSLSNIDEVHRRYDEFYNLFLSENFSKEEAMTNAKVLSFVSYDEFKKTPDFAVDIFNSEYISDIEKIHFYDRFLKKYLDDEVFREEVREMNIYVLDGKMYEYGDRPSEYFRPGRLLTFKI